MSSIGSAIRHLKVCKGKGALLVPVWPSSYIWPLIYPNGKQMADFIKIIIIEPFYCSEAADSVFNGYTKFKTIILNIDCSNRCIVSTNVSFHVDKQHESKIGN